MNDKYILIGLGLIILALVIGIGVALFSPSEVTYETLSISNGTTIEVPQTDDATWAVNENGIKTYECPSKNVVMNTYNTAEDSTIEGSDEFSLIDYRILDGANDVEVYNNYSIKENDINNTHFYIVSIGNYTTHDNIIIASEDLDILKHMIDSIVFGIPAVTDYDENDTVEDTSYDETDNDDSGYQDDYSPSSTPSSSTPSSDSNADHQGSGSSSGSSKTPSNSGSGSSSGSSKTPSNSGSGSSSGSSKTPSNSGGSGSNDGGGHADFE